MKAHTHRPAKRGFTLLELIVAMAITTIIVTVLVSVTSVALDTFNRSRSELRASRQAKSMIDSMARDLEALVIRSGNSSQWLSATSLGADPIGDNLPSTSAAKLIFFTTATDRYDGEIGSSNPDDRGGDVSCVAYQLRFSDPVQPTVNSNINTFVLNRLLVNPDMTFTQILGKTDSQATPPVTLLAIFEGYNGMLSQTTNLAAGNNFIAENIYQFTLIFNVQLALPSPSGPPTYEMVPIYVGLPNADGLNTDNFVESLEINGDSLTVSSGIANYTVDDLKAGKVLSITVAVTAISDFAIDQSRGRAGLRNNPDQRADFLDKNSYQYTKTVQIPGR